MAVAARPPDLGIGHRESAPAIIALKHNGRPVEAAISFSTVLSTVFVA
jgi:hypothetical protein